MHKEFVSIFTTAAFVVYTLAAAAGADKVDPAAAVGKKTVPPEKSAQLSVLTGGETCSVYCDGELMGDSPVSFPVEPGKHKVQAVPFRGKSKEKTVSIKEHENLEVHFSFPLPKPVEAAMKGKYESDDGGSFFLGLSELDVAFGVCIIAIVAAAIVVANSGGSSHSSVSVQNGTIAASFRTDEPAGDGGQIAIYVNGSKVNELTLDTLDTPMTLHLSTGTNTVTIEALSMGSTPGNTGTLTISDGFGNTTELHWNLPAVGSMQHFTVNGP